jgi:hypothetical protein
MVQGGARETYDMWMGQPKKRGKDRKSVESGSSGHLLSVMKRVVEWD